MRIQMQINTLRYMRYAAMAWLFFLTSFGLMQFGDAIYGQLPIAHTILTYLAEASFGAGCIGIVGTVGMRVFARSAAY